MKVNPRLPWIALAVAFSAAVLPFVSQDYWIHNDARIGDRAGDLTLPFGHVEAYHLARIGRIIGAYLYVLQWGLLDSYTDLKFHRIAAVLMQAAALVLLGRHLVRETKLSLLQAGIFSLLLFMLPPFLLNTYYASHVVPGSLNIVLVFLLYAFHWKGLRKADIPGAPSWQAARHVLARSRRLLLVAAGLIASFLIYFPTTCLFLIYGAAHLAFGAREHRHRHKVLALVDGGLFLLALAGYVMLQNLMWPWADAQNWYAGRFTDYSYSFFAAFEPDRQVGIVAQAAGASLNLWNAVEGLPLGWATASICIAAVGHKLLRARFDRAELHHVMFSGAWILGIAVFSVAPVVLTGKSLPGYRVLFVPMAIVWMVLLWSILYLGIIANRSRVDLALVSLGLAGSASAVYLLATCVAHERAAIKCTERIFLTQDLSHNSNVYFLKGMPAVPKPLFHYRFEFGWHFASKGPRHEMGWNVRREMVRAGTTTSAIKAQQFQHDQPPEFRDATDFPRHVAIIDFVPGQCSVRTKAGIRRVLQD